MARAHAVRDLPRMWPCIELPGCRDAPSDYATYGAWPVDELPPIARPLDDDLEWLHTQPRVPDSLAESPASPDPSRPATSEELRRLLGEQQLAFPRAFTAFICDQEPRSRVRSATACYLDLADSIVPAVDGGYLVHFLSDQQWVLHWLLYVRAGAEAVIATETPYGFHGEAPTAFEPVSDAAVVCAESFLEFLYRFWIENEIWFALADPDGEQRPLKEEERRYVEHYRRHE